MIIRFDTSQLNEELKQKLDIKELLRPVAEDLLSEMQHRIHVEGKGENDQPIGSYSNQYLKFRNGAYKNSLKNDAGFFTKGKNAVYDIKTKKAIKLKNTKENKHLGDTMREHYKRGWDPKIVVSLSRALEEDWSVVPTDRGWGIGFKNIHNAQKMRWVEERKGKSIAAPTEGETQYAIDMLNELVDEKINE